MASHKNNSNRASSRVSASEGVSAREEPTPSLLPAIEEKPEPAPTTPAVEPTVQHPEALSSPVDATEASSPAVIEHPDAPKRYRVWPHGTLQRDGKTYRPGDELILPEAEAIKIPALIRVN
jgi:hypothetical protein